jgi:hypothetical protein
VDPRDLTIAEFDQTFVSEERELRILNALKGLNPEDKTLYLQRYGLPVARTATDTFSPDEAKPYPTFDPTEVMNQPPVEWLVPGYLPRKGLSQLVAASGSGKSFVALDWAIDLARQDHNVLYVAGEGFTGMGGRLRAWRYVNGDLPKDHLRFRNPSLIPDLTDSASVSDFIESVRYDVEGSYSLIILDTLARVMTGNENDAEIVGNAVKACAHISAELGGAVLLVHHFGWDGSRQRGSSALYAACDAVIHMEVADKDTKTSRVFVEKMKDGESGPAFYVQMYAPDPDRTDEATIQHVGKPTGADKRAEFKQNVRVALEGGKGLNTGQLMLALGMKSKGQAYTQATNWLNEFADPTQDNLLVSWDEGPSIMWKLRFDL